MLASNASGLHVVGAARFGGFKGEVGPGQMRLVQSLPVLAFLLQLR